MGSLDQVYIFILTVTCLFFDEMAFVAQTRQTVKLSLASILVDNVPKVCLVLEAVNLPEVRAGRSGEGSASPGLLIQMP